MKRPLLLPLVPLYAAGLALRDHRLRRGWEPVRRLRYPVICIGNLSTGGSGKTPLAIALARLLTARGYHVDVLSRGYGRSGGGPTRVPPDGTAQQFGDEPLLIARETGVPVYVASERYDAGKLAEADRDPQREMGPAYDFSHVEGPAKQTGASAPELPRVHILDDGFQHRQLARDIDIVLLNRADWHDSLLPAGNLREPLRASRRAHILAIPHTELDLETELRTWGWNEPIWRLHRHIQIPSIVGPVAAFCGIARPGQFFAGIQAAGFSLVSQTAFADHHRYTQRDIENLIAKGRNAGAGAFLTTEKDFVRLGGLAATFPKEIALRTVCLTIKIQDESACISWLAARLATTREGAPL